MKPKRKEIKSDDLLPLTNKMIDKINPSLNYMKDLGYNLSCDDWEGYIKACEERIAEVVWDTRWHSDCGNHTAKAIIQEILK